jgi:Domain of unknown function (DUF4272)
MMDADQGLRCSSVSGCQDLDARFDDDVDFSIVGKLASSFSRFGRERTWWMDKLPFGGNFIAPRPERVAARAMALVGVACRAVLEFEADRSEAEFKRLHLCKWLDRIGVSDELEEKETSLLITPYRLLDERTLANAQWRGEGMLVLAWSLGRAELVRYDEECNAAEVAGRLGFLSERSQTVLTNPLLRESAEIRRWRDTYLTIHWRLREYDLTPIPLDFPDVVAQFNWGPLRLGDLELIDGDLAICGRRIDRASEDDRDRTYSIALERHKAFNWLVGSAAVYSAVSTDT